MKISSRYYPFLCVAAIMLPCRTFAQAPTPTPPSADVDPSGFIDQSDLFVVADGWHNETDFSGGDIDGSTRVGPEDVLILLERWRTSTTKDAPLRLEWVKHPGGSNTEVFASEIAALPDGSFLVTGGFHGSVTFGDGGNAITVTTRGQGDSFVAKYNSDGTILWVKQSGGPDAFVDTRGFGASADGSFAVTGLFGGAATFGEGPNRRSLTSFGRFDIFVAKYASDGTLEWVTQSGESDSGEYEIGQDVAISSDGSVLMTGFFWGVSSFRPGNRCRGFRPLTLTSRGHHDIVAAKYNPQGCLLWASQAGGSGPDNGCGIGPTPGGGALVVGAYFYPFSIFGTGDREVVLNLESGESSHGFMAKYNQDGQLDWVRRIGSAFVGAVSVLPDGCGLLTGSFSTTANFGGSDDGLVITPVGDTDMIIAKYQLDGSLAWVSQAGGTDFFGQGLGITTLPDGSSIVAGEFSPPGVGGAPGNTFNFGVGDREVTLASRGDTDIFVSKYDPHGNFVWAERAGGPGRDYFSDVSAAPDGSIFVTGQFSGEATFGEGDNQVTLTSIGDFGAFIAKYVPVELP